MRALAGGVWAAVVQHSKPGGRSLFGAAAFQTFRTTTATGLTMHPDVGGDIATNSESAYRHRVFVAVGSNLGNCYQNIWSALQQLCHDHMIQLHDTSFLYMTAPMYVTDQPKFLNGVVEVRTQLEEPREFLRRIKAVESALGRNITTDVRHGPRTVDLDMVLWETWDPTFCSEDDDDDHDDDDDDNDGDDDYHQDKPTTWFPRGHKDEQLVIPHAGLPEREFVLQPLCELVGRAHYLFGYYFYREDGTIGSGGGHSIGELLNIALEDKKSNISSELVRVVPLPRGRFIQFNRTVIMGILNVTPDSFSDGDQFTDPDTAVQHALRMVQQGAGIIDIGGESTRPGAPPVSLADELDRTIPVIAALRQASDDIAISIDTRHAAVARAAVAAGADLVNDVSGGADDPNMLATVAELGVPIILMHSRGTPQTMHQLTYYDDIVPDVIAALKERMRAASAAGIPRWLQIVDPGIGFAKDLPGNLQLLRNIGRIRKGVGGAPILLGTSRKGFIGKITNIDRPEDRDVGSVASVVTALSMDRTNPLVGACNIVRVHNVANTKQGIDMMDATHGRSTGLDDGPT